MLFLGPMVGVFSTLNLLWFFIFWEFTLIPMFFHIGIWGAENRIYAAMKFIIYTHLASVFLLLGIIILYLKTHTFDFVNLAGISLDPSVAKIVWILMFIGFAVKMPVVPFHTWLPDAHVQAPSPISVFLAGLLLKMGAYGLLRWEILLLPETTKQFAPLMAFIALLTIFYAGFKALAEDHIKRMVAYSSINHMGFVLLGLSALIPAGISSALYEMVGHALIISLLFMIAGYVHHKTHTWYLDEMGGIMKKAPYISAIFILAGMAGLGLPGTMGFVGELTIIVSAIKSFGWWIAVIAIASLISAGYIIWAIRRSIHGEMSNIVVNATFKMSIPEKAALAIFAFMIIYFGIQPQPIFDLANKAFSFLGGM